MRALKASEEPSTQTSSTPEFSFWDRVSGSREFTRNPTVGITASGTERATRFCLSETQVEPPTQEGSCAWTTAVPRTFLLSEGDGFKTVHIWWQNQSGAIEGSSFRILVDRQAPMVNLPTPPATITNQTSVSFAFSVTEGGSGLAQTTCRVDGAAPVSCTNSFPSTTLTAGTHNLVIETTDRAGNAGSRTLPITVDTTAPVFANPSAAAPSVAARSATLSISVSDNVALNLASVNCLHNTAAVACTATSNSISVPLSSIPNGANTVVANIRDTAGNLGTATVRWTANNVAPTVLITSLTAGVTRGGTTNSPTAVFSFSGTGAASFECRTGTPTPVAAFTACPANFTFPGSGSLTSGTYTVQARSVSSTGVPSDNFDTFTWTVLIEAPTPAVPADPVYPSPNPLTDTRRYGISDDHGIAGYRLGNGGYQAVCSMGMGLVRYWMYWDIAQMRGANIFDWESADEDIHRMLRAGVNVYINIGWAPPWAFQGSQAMLPWRCMDPATTNFTPERPCCNYQYDLNLDGFREFVQAAVHRYGRWVKFWGFTNEFESAVFWHNSRTGVAANPYSSVAAIGYDTVKSMDPSARVVGPESINTETFEYDLQQEAATGRRLYDVLSFHAYGESSAATRALGCAVSDSVCQIDRVYRPIYERYAQGRDAWITESFVTHWQTIQPYVEANPWVKKFMPHGFKESPQDPNAACTNSLLLCPNNTLTTYGAGIRNILAARYGTPSCPSDVPPPPPINPASSIVMNASNGNRYFAEGCSIGAENFANFQTVYDLMNPYDAPTTVRAYSRSDGGPLVERVFSVPAHSVKRLSQTDLFNDRTCRHVTFQSFPSGQLIFVERTIFTGYAYNTGEFANQAFLAPDVRGMGSDVGSSALSTTWYFPEGGTNYGYWKPYLSLLNPQPAAATVTVRVWSSSGAEIAARTVTVGAASRYSFSVQNEFPAVAPQDASFSVESDRPIMADRVIYFGAGNFQRLDLNTGASSAQTQWYFSEGGTGFTSYMLLYNPNSTALAISFTARAPSGVAVAATTVNCPARGRCQRAILEELLAGATYRGDLTYELAASLPFTAELSSYLAGFSEGYTLSGHPTGANNWFIPSLKESTVWDSYIQVRAVSAASVIRITLFTDRGEIAVLPDQAIPAGGRYTFGSPGLSAVANRSFSARVQVISGGPVVASHANFQSRYAGQAWFAAAGSLGIPQ